MDKKRVSVMPMRIEMERVNKLNYLKKLINNLYENEEYLLPVFLLRSQLVEFSLKYLLLNHPYPSSKFRKNKLDTLTMGQMLKELEGFNDSYMEDIITNLSQLIAYRNEFIHRFIDSEKDVTFVKECARDGMECANKVEQNIWYYLDYTEKVLR